MNDTIVRIESVEIHNFKNVICGRLDFENAKNGRNASILGLYGQNGSGKTALIDALELLRLALTGRAIPSHFADYIHVESDCARFRYGFSVKHRGADCVCSAVYEFSLRREAAPPEQNTDLPTTGESCCAVLCDEVLSGSWTREGTKIRFSPIMDTRTAAHAAFLPAARYQAMMGKDRATLTGLLVAKQLARETSRSFLFSRELLHALRQNCQEEYPRSLVESLVFFGNYQLFVVRTTHAGLVSMDAFPIAMPRAEDGKTAPGNLLIHLDEPSLIPETARATVSRVIDCMNVVLQQLIPGLTISIRDMGTQLYPNGTPGCRIQLMSRKNQKEIPLQYESEGIKKLISILQLLIAIYNKPSMTVAIDELDSGVFEYLLGEILRILAEKGKGQLMFTSHNLRPLETLDKQFIAFTTTNPEKRYIRMSHVKTSNNLRDFYYRDIVLGEQHDPVYELTNNSEIAMAFREAGSPDAT